MYWTPRETRRHANLPVLSVNKLKKGLTLSRKLQTALSPCSSIRQSDNFTGRLLPLTDPPSQAAILPQTKPVAR